MNTIEEFISKLQLDWQKEQCTLLYAIQNAASEDIVGEIKWENPYFSLNNKFLLKWFCGKAHINVYFAKGIELDDPNNLFEPTDNKKMRTIKLFIDSDLDQEAYRKLVESAIHKNI